MDTEITDLGSPPKSQDLKWIENGRGELSRRVYDCARQFDTPEDLLEALHYEWDELDISHIRSLNSSMSNRVRECQVKGGRVTNY